jgi:hypothetical protein
LNRPDFIDYDVHAIVGVRLVNPSPGDAAAVARQLGPLARPLEREPDIIVEFVRELDTPDLRYLGLNKHAFTDDGYYTLQSSKARARVRIPFDQIGGQCHILCETGLRSVPLLLSIINLTALKSDCAPLHASAFLYNDSGILVTGWAKGGKTESLLAFAQEGAQYVGDEWILLSGDGRRMYGIPEYIRLWDWHLKYLPHVRSRLGIGESFLFRSIHALDRLQAAVRSPRLSKAYPVRTMREAMPALRRQLNVQVNPEAVFRGRFGPFAAEPRKVFFLISRESSPIEVEECDPQLVAGQMISSIQYEQLPFWEHYLAFRFAFPQKRNDFIESARDRQLSILRRALAGKETYRVLHPYPVDLSELFKQMSPFCRRVSEKAPVAV